MAGPDDTSTTLGGVQWIKPTDRELEAATISPKAAAAAWAMLEARVAHQISNNDAMDAKANGFLAALVPTLVAIGGGMFLVLKDGAIAWAAALAVLGLHLGLAAMFALAAARPVDIARRGLSPEWILLKKAGEPMQMLTKEYVAVEQWRAMRDRVADLRKAEKQSKQKSEWLTGAQTCAAWGMPAAVVAGLIAALVRP
jgi:hypothetical protein